MLGEGRWDMNTPTFSVATMAAMYNLLIRSRGYSDPTGLTGGAKHMAEDYNKETEKLLSDFCVLHDEAQKAATALAQFAEKHRLTSGS